jgi:phosphoribosylformylglycinamidine cyclo-ligase
MSEDYQKRESKAVDAIKKAIPKKLKQNMLASSKGMFCELYETAAVPDYYVATACDGVGTKLILAEAMGIYDTVGIDLVAMNANDLVCFGKVAPFMFINYIAVQEKFASKGITGDVLKGMVKGLEMCEAADILKNDIHVQLGKGETASVDELISGPKPGMAFDVAGSMIGFIAKKDFSKRVPQVGDKIIALKSSGPHSNGYTDLRLKLLNGDFEERTEWKKRYTGKHSLNDKFDGSTIGKLLLEPTKIYVKVVNAIASKFDCIYANNTGYGLKNLNRFDEKVSFEITDPIEPQPIFKLVQEESGFTDEQMYTKFNMGMGFFVITSDPKEVLLICKEFKQEAKVIGEVKKSDTTQVVLKDMVFKGY